MLHLTSTLATQGVAGCTPEKVWRLLTERTTGFYDLRKRITLVVKGYLDPAACFHMKEDVFQAYSYYIIIYNIRDLRTSILAFVESVQSFALPVDVLLLVQRYFFTLY